MDNKLISSLVALPAPSEDDAFDFTHLKLIEKPDSPLNSHSLLQKTHRTLPSSLLQRMDAENPRKIEAAESEAEALKIAQKAVAQAESTAILMKAEANAKAAEAEAESLKIATKAEAEAVLLTAEAEAEAIRMKAAAESERAQVLSKTKFGQQECLLGIYSEMIQQSNSGVEKVVYLDPSVNRNSPFALGSLDNLNRDLHSLSLMGIASNEHAEAENSGGFVQVEDGEEKKENEDLD